jgi:hypothetical protein
MENLMGEVSATPDIRLKVGTLSILVAIITSFTLNDFSCFDSSLVIYWIWFLHEIIIVMILVSGVGQSKSVHFLCLLPCSEACFKIVITLFQSDTGSVIPSVNLGNFSYDRQPKMPASCSTPACGSKVPAPTPSLPTSGWEELDIYQQRRTIERDYSPNNQSISPEYEEVGDPITDAM